MWTYCLFIYLFIGFTYILPEVNLALKADLFELP